MGANGAVAKGEFELSSKEMTKIIAASSMGTMIEWYDFYIFGSLAAVIASKFYNTGTPLGNIIAWLAAFAVGFIVRPFGAVVFGRVGDLIGRKYTFLVTMTLMGLCTFAVGLLPTIDMIGPSAGIILILLRILQGLALGGEYGGAATYVAEHSPNGKRGFYTSFIQITATAGLFMSLGVILATRLWMGNDQFSGIGAYAGQYWAGWRVPFLLSIILVAVSLYIRYKMAESPLFSKLKKSGGVSKNPILESFGNKENLRWVLLALFGATMGQGVVWYTGQFYALFYLQQIFHVDLVTSNVIVAGALLVATPLFVVMGKWSDTFGRKKIMLAGMLLAVVTYFPLYGLMAASAPSYYKASAADVAAFQKSATEAQAAGKTVPQVSLRPADTKIDATLADEGTVTKVDASSVKVGDKVAVKFEGIFGIPRMSFNPWILALCVFIQVVYVTMVYGPIAAFLVELFPTKIRYTSMSLPYHIGNGVFGGMVPIIGLSLIGATGWNYAGLIYPTAIAATCFLVGLALVKETNHIDIHKDESMAKEYGTIPVDIDPSLAPELSYSPEDRPPHEG